MVTFSRYPKLTLSREGQCLVNRLNREIAEGLVELRDYPCVSCGAQAPRTIFLDDAYGIDQHCVQCTKCGLIYSNPRMTPGSQDRFYESDVYRQLYDEHTGKGEPVGLANQEISVGLSLNDTDRLDSTYTPFSFFHFLKEHLCVRGIDSVAEIGAGSGAKLAPFVVMGKRVYGVELSRLLSENAWLRKIYSPMRSIEELQGRDVDLVQLIHCLEHLHDPVGTLRTIVELGPRYVLIEVPGVITRLGHVQNAHNFYFSENTLKRVCSRAGLRCVATHFYRSNNFLLALLVPDALHEYEYSFDEELKRTKRVIMLQKVKNLIPAPAKKWGRGLYEVFGGAWS